MFDFTFTQWIIVGLVLVLGWLLGLASRDGGRRYRRELEDERRAHEIYRRDSDARYAELDRTRPVAVHRDHDTVVHRDTAVHRDSAVDNLDLRNRDERTVVRDDVDDHGRTVIRPTRP